MRGHGSPSPPPPPRAPNPRARRRGVDIPLPPQAAKQSRRSKKLISADNPEQGYYDLLAESGEGRPQARSIGCLEQG